MRVQPNGDKEKSSLVVFVVTARLTIYLVRPFSLFFCVLLLCFTLGISHTTRLAKVVIYNPSSRTISDLTHWSIVRHARRHKVRLRVARLLRC